MTQIEPATDDYIASVRLLFINDEARLGRTWTHEMLERFVARFEAEQAKKREMAEEIAGLKHRERGYQLECWAVEKALGFALGYPHIWTHPDHGVVADDFPGAIKSDDVCIGEHTPTTIAEEASRALKERDQKIAKLRAELLDYQHDWAHWFNKWTNTLDREARKSEEIAKLKERIAEQEKEIDELVGVLTEAEVSLPSEPSTALNVIRAALSKASPDPAPKCHYDPPQCNGIGCRCAQLNADVEDMRRRGFFKASVDEGGGE